MSNMHSVDVVIFGTRVSLLTDEPQEISRLADELNRHLNLLANQYPGVKQNLILTLECLKLLEENKKLNMEMTELSIEREKLNKTLQNFLSKID